MQADDILGFRLSQLAWEGPEEQLNDTINTQPALFTHSIAVLQVIHDLNLDLLPSFVAGHSMGELSALVAAGAISFGDGLRLVRTRGELYPDYAGLAEPLSKDSAAYLLPAAMLPQSHNRNIPVDIDP